MYRSDPRGRPRSRVPLLVFALFALVTTVLSAPVRPVQAAVPDRWGFAFNNQLTPPAGTVMPPARQWGSWKTAFPADWATVGWVAPGTYEVRFPHLAGKGVAHVTAVDDAPVWCQLLKWGPAAGDELAYVRCHTPGGAPRNARFTIMYSESSGPAGVPYGWVFANPGGGLVNSFNASGAANSVAHLGVGQYRVDVPGLGGGFNGNVQVTAVNPTIPARCKVATWGPGAAVQTVIVYCHDAVGAPVDSAFTLTYHHKVAMFGGISPPTRFGYVWDTLGAIPPGANINTSGAPNTVVAAGPGLRLVTFPHIGVDPSHVQVTADGPGPEFCNLLTPWAILGADAVVRDVACYTAAGARVNQRSFVSYTSRF
jgi:hypothetical protein